MNEAEIKEEIRNLLGNMEKNQSSQRTTATRDQVQDATQPGPKMMTRAQRDTSVGITGRAMLKYLRDNPSGTISMHIDTPEEQK